MCLAILKCSPKKLDPDIYRNAFANNGDGAGFAFIDNEKLYIAKGYFKFDEFWEDFQPFEEKARLIHFRLGSSGGQNPENCHPWRINDNLVFIHNGVITIDRPNQSLSDTGNYCMDILQPLTKECSDWWKQKEYIWMMENALGSTNKVILLDNLGHYQIFNEKAGEWKDDCWFSNSSYSYSRSCRNSSSPVVGSVAWGDDDFSSKNRFNLESETENLVDIDVQSIDARLEAAEEARQRTKKQSSM